MSDQQAKTILSPAEIEAFRNNLNPNQNISAELRDLAFRQLIASRNLGRRDHLNYFLSECIAAVREGRDIFEAAKNAKQRCNELAEEIDESLRTENEMYRKYIHSTGALIHSDIAEIQKLIDEGQLNFDLSVLLKSLALANALFPTPFEEAAYTPGDKAYLTIITNLDPEFYLHISLLQSSKRDGRQIGVRLGDHYLEKIHSPEKYTFIFNPMKLSRYISDVARAQIMNGFIENIYNRIHKEGAKYDLDFLEMLTRDFGRYVYPTNFALCEAIEELSTSFAPYCVPIVEHQLFRYGFTNSQHYASFLRHELGMSTDAFKATEENQELLVAMCDAITHTQDPHVSVAYLNELVDYMQTDFWASKRLLASLNPAEPKPNSGKHVFHRWTSVISENRRDELIALANEIAIYRKLDIAKGFKDIHETVGDEVKTSELPYVTEMYARLTMKEQDRIRLARLLFKTERPKALASGLSALVGVSDNVEVVRSIAFGLKSDVLGLYTESSTDAIARLAPEIRASKPFYDPTPALVIAR